MDTTPPAAAAKHVVTKVNEVCSGSADKTEPPLNPNQPNHRSGIGFSDYCACVNQIKKLKPRAKVYFLAENFPHPELCLAFRPNNNFYFFNDSMHWKRDLHIMSQSQLLIGGSSSFVVLGAQLCEDCTVIHNTAIKFAKSDYEKKLPIHLKHF